jgi:DNA-binding NtrC family response regulator
MGFLIWEMNPSTPLLVIDDNKALGNAYELLLEEHGFHVMSASSGDEAIGLCERGPSNVSLAIVDLRMPGLDGPATIAALRGRTPELKVIAVSGQMLSPYFARLSDLGVRHFLPKPFGIDGLLEAIHDVLKAA